MENSKGVIYAVATADTKGKELHFIRDLIAETGAQVVTVDLSTQRLSDKSGTDFTADRIADYHPQGQKAVFCQDRGRAINAMTLAFKNFLSQRDDVAGIIGLGGSGGTALITPAMQGLPVGIPKIMVSTMASGNVSGYVGASDITMLYPVTDIAGLHHISRQVLGNAAHQIAGAVLFQQKANTADKPALGLTMFGVTTPCIQSVSQALETEYDCLIFHATGSGGKSMEKLLESGSLSGIFDLTTTEVCDLLLGGVLACDETRFAAIANSLTPCVISSGALDMVNFAAPETIPTKYAGRLFYYHNAQVTLMRTTVEENIAIATWIAGRLNRSRGEVRFLIPLGGFSALDAPGEPFWLPQASEAFASTLEAELIPTAQRQIVRLPYHINDPLFAEAAVTTFRSLVTQEA